MKKTGDRGRERTDAETMRLPVKKTKCSGEAEGGDRRNRRECTVRSPGAICARFTSKDGESGQSLKTTSNSREFTPAYTEYRHTRL